MHVLYPETQSSKSERGASEGVKWVTPGTPVRGQVPSGQLCQPPRAATTKSQTGWLKQQGFAQGFGGWSSKGFPCGSAGKESARNAGDLGSIPGLGRSPGEGKGCLLQYSGLENPMDCVVHGVAKSHPALSGFLVTLQELRAGSGGCPEPLCTHSRYCGHLQHPHQQTLQRYGLNRKGMATD